MALTCKASSEHNSVPACSRGLTCNLLPRTTPPRTGCPGSLLWTGRPGLRALERAPEGPVAYELLAAPLGPGRPVRGGVTLDCVTPDGAAPEPYLPGSGVAMAPRGAPRALLENAANWPDKVVPSVHSRPGAQQAPQAVGAHLATVSWTGLVGLAAAREAKHKAA